MRTPEQILKESTTIAVVGLSPDPLRDSNSVSVYLRGEGYTIIPINPTVNEVLGLKCYPSLRDIPRPVDIVDVFRRSEAVMPLAQEAVAIGAKALWLQLGVINEEAAAMAAEAGLDVVMDECTARLHAQLKREGRI